MRIHFEPYRNHTWSFALELFVGGINNRVFGIRVKLPFLFSLFFDFQWWRINQLMNKDHSTRVTGFYYAHHLRFIKAHIWQNDIIQTNKDLSWSKFLSDD